MTQGTPGEEPVDDGEGIKCRSRIMHTLGVRGLQAAGQERPVCREVIWLKAQPWEASRLYNVVATMNVAETTMHSENRRCSQP